MGTLAACGAGLLSESPVFPVLGWPGEFTYAHFPRATGAGRRTSLCRAAVGRPAWVPAASPPPPSPCREPLDQERCLWL